MNVAEYIAKILENAGVKHIFGHPGEQIIPFYGALANSKIEHILMRHEQAAVHAADGYARVSGEFGVCVSTAGPGALNMVMGVGVAFKDSIPLLVITGNNPSNHQNKDGFQDINIRAVFEPITIKSFNPVNSKSAIESIKNAIKILKNEPRGPIHINLPKDVLLDKNIIDIVNEDLISYKVNEDSSLCKGKLESFDESYNYSKVDYALSEIKKALSEIKKSKKPLIVVGAGIFWANAVNELKKFLKINKIPIAHTYHSKGLIKDYDFELGLVGIRGSKMANFAFKNADLIIFLGSKISERTVAINNNYENSINNISNSNSNSNISCNSNSNFDSNSNSNFDSDFNYNSNSNFNYNSDSNFNYNSDSNYIFNSNFNSKKSKTKIISVNIDKKSLMGDIKIHGDVKKVLNDFNSLIIDKNTSNNPWIEWREDIFKNNEKISIDGLKSEKIPLKPQVAIKLMIDSFNGSILINDAGSHTTWVNLISEFYNKRIIFSGAMGPMGYGLPAACGASFANPNKNILLINGDGGFQMNIQELATISYNKLPILIVVLNNSQLGIIRQWENSYNENLRYSVDLDNPDFVKLANAYGIEAKSVNSKEKLKKAIKDLKLDKPYLLEILVDEEDIPVVKS